MNQSNRLRVLIVEDSDSDMLLLLRELRRAGFDVAHQRVETAKELRDALQGQRWDVVLSDYQMPRFSGLDALEIVKSQDPDVPFVVISGTIGEDLAVEAMKAGVHDYLMKGHLKRLGPAIRRELQDAQTRRERRWGVERLHHLNQVLRAIRSVNQLIVREKDPRRLIERACECLVESRGYRSAWIAVFDGRDALQTTASTGMGERFEGMEVQLRSGILPRCFTNAVSSGEVVIVTDPETFCSGCPWIDCSCGRGSLTCRLESDGTTYGILSVNVGSGFVCDAEDASLIAEIAGDIGFALRSLETNRALSVEMATTKVLIDAIPDTIFAFEPSTGRAVLWNHEFRRVSGYTDAEIAARPAPQSYYGPDDLARAARATEAVAGGKAVTVELSLVTKRGKRIPTEYVATSLPSRTSAEPLLLAIGRDVTERQAAERALRLSEEKFRTFFDEAPEYCYMVSPAGRILDVNRSALDALGYEKDELVGSPVAALYDEASGARAQRLLAIWKDTGRLENEELVVLTKAGVKRSVLLSASAVRDECGALAYSLSVQRDVTEIKAAEDALLKAASTWQATFDAISDIVCVLSPSREFIEVNQAGCRAVGLRREQIIGRKCFEVLHGRSSPIPECPCAQTLRTCEPNNGRYCDDGMTLQLSAWPVLDETRRLVSLVHVISDVTARVELETQLAQADRLSSMGMLAAGVAHEINNPLSYVLYNLESLTEDLPEVLKAVREVQAWAEECTDAKRSLGDLDSVAQKVNPVLLADIQAKFKDALEGAHRIRDIARGLGAFSRVERDQVVPVTLPHVVEAALKLASNEIKYRARLIKDLRKTPAIMASEGRLSQVFLNLLINATHAIEEGDVEDNEIGVRTWTDGEFACAEVRDTGCGIPRQDFAKLFDPFFTTKRIGVGSGLGLAISKSIVESYGGTIAVQSELGVGTSFTIRLPIRAPANQPQALAAPDHDVPQIRGRILVVDDEDGIRAAMIRMLREHDTLQAASGAEAKKILEHDQAFDVILCDMMMSDVSGMELHQWLLQIHPGLAKRLIFITGGAFTPKTRDYLGKVGNMRLEKPFDATNFKKIVNDRVVLARSGVS